MLTLPNFKQLPVEHLAAGFDNVTNSYKFYWFLAILDHIRENRSPIILMNELLARMMAGVWYPTNYFRLSFGKQDRLGQMAIELGINAGLSMDIDRQEFIAWLIRHLSQDSDTSRKIKNFGNYVPFRFLRPFFARELRGVNDWEVNRKIEIFAERAFNDVIDPCLYHFISKPDFGIEIHPTWFEYLNHHLSILTGFCLWHLVNYIQKNNPNVSNIPSASSIDIFGYFDERQNGLIKDSTDTVNQFIGR